MLTDTDPPLHTSHRHKTKLEFLRAETGFDGLILTGLSDRCIVIGAPSVLRKGQQTRELSPASPVWPSLYPCRHPVSPMKDWCGLMAAPGPACGYESCLAGRGCNVAAPVSARGKVWSLHRALRAQSRLQQTSSYGETYSTYCHQGRQL